MLLQLDIGLRAVGKAPVVLELRKVVDADAGLLNFALQGDDEFRRRLSHIALVEVAIGLAKSLEDLLDEARLLLTGGHGVGRFLGSSHRL